MDVCNLFTSHARIFLSGRLYQPLLDLTGHFRWMFVDPPPLMLFHIGQEEVNCLIDLMEPEFSEPMLFQQRDGATQDPVFDLAQVVGVQSTVPKLSVPLALKDVKSPESSALGLSNVYEYKHLLAYLKANSRDTDRPLLPFRVSGCLHWMFLIQVVVCTE